MKNSPILRLVGLVVALFVMAGCASGKTEELKVKTFPLAASDSRPPRVVPSLGREFIDRLQPTQKYLAVRDFEAAETSLHQAINGFHLLNDHQKAVIWQLRALLSYGRGDTRETIKAYEIILSLGDSLPLLLEAQINAGLSYLHSTTGDFNLANDYLDACHRLISKEAGSYPCSVNTMGPLPVNRANPWYPPLARRDGVEGYAVVEFTVGADGKPIMDTLKIIESQPRGYFETVARKTVKKFVYEPAVVEGRAQPMHGVRYRFSFVLTDE